MDNQNRCRSRIDNDRIPAAASEVASIAKTCEGGTTTTVGTKRPPSKLANADARSIAVVPFATMAAATCAVRDADMRWDQFYASAWRPALKAAGLEGRFVFHSLRHFCASSMLAEGAPITAVAGHLGDTVETVTKTYAHWLRDDRDVPASVLDRLLMPAADDAESGTR